MQYNEIVVDVRFSQYRKNRIFIILATSVSSDKTRQGDVSQ